MLEEYKISKDPKIAQQLLQKVRNNRVTNEVFCLEVRNSGYHKLISEAVKTLSDYELISDEFNNQLGNEAVMLLRTLLALHKLEDE